jgi:hypothetical protein
MATRRAEGRAPKTIANHVTFAHGVFAYSPASWRSQVASWSKYLDASI